jgi:uncharacterized protein DUF4337
MSEEGFHVHGAHDHEVEHQARHGPGLAQQVAIFTAILSTIGALISYEGGYTQNEAILHKNQAVLHKAQASDQWNFYQAKSMKQNLSEFAAQLAPPDKGENFRKEAERYSLEKKEIKAEAERLEKLAAEADDRSAAALHPHHRLAQSMTLIQVAISLASITVLTRRRWLLTVAAAAAAGALGVLALAFLA